MPVELNDGSEVVPCANVYVRLTVSVAGSTTMNELPAPIHTSVPCGFGSAQAGATMSGFVIVARSASEELNTCTWFFPPWIAGEYSFEPSGRMPRLIPALLSLREPPCALCGGDTERSHLLM